MSNDALAELAAFVAQAEWRRAPGAWRQPSGGPTLSKDAREDIDTLLRVSVPTREVRTAAIDAIGVFVWQYRLDRERAEGTPNGRAFRAWVRAADKRLLRELEWLSRDPLPEPVAARVDGADLAEVFTWERENLARQIAEFRDWLQAAYDPARRPGRPVDLPRADLDDSVGTVLSIVGHVPEDSESGVFAGVLQTIYAEVDPGRRGDSNATLRRAVQAAVAHHPEWRRA